MTFVEADLRKSGAAYHRPSSQRGGETITRKAGVTGVRGSARLPERWGLHCGDQGGGNSRDSDCSQICDGQSTQRPQTSIAFNALLTNASKQISCKQHVSISFNKCFYLVLCGRMCRTPSYESSCNFNHIRTGCAWRPSGIGPGAWHRAASVCDAARLTLTYLNGRP